MRTESRLNPCYVVSWYVLINLCYTPLLTHYLNNIIDKSKYKNTLLSAFLMIDQSNIKKKMTISSIIPTYYRPEDLIVLFQSLLKQTKLPKEIVIVDYTPDDSTETSAQEIRLQQIAEFTALKDALDSVVVFLGTITEF